MAIWKLGGLALASVLGSGLLIGQASAMPAANGMATVASKVGNGTEQVRWAGGGWRGCRLARCWLARRRLARHGLARRRLARRRMAWRLGL